MWPSAQKTRIAPASTWSSGWSDAGIEAIDELEEIGRRQDIEIVLMGGIRDGVDAVKALCLGADAVAFGTGRLLVVSHAERPPRTRLISARPATRNERKHHEQDT